LRVTIFRVLTGLINLAYFKEGERERERVEQVVVYFAYGDWRWQRESFFQCMREKERDWWVGAVP
jgi:hypothetical protein